MSEKLQIFSYCDNQRLFWDSNFNFFWANFFVIKKDFFGIQDIFQDTCDVKKKSSKDFCTCKTKGTWSYFPDTLFYVITHNQTSVVLKKSLGKKKKILSQSPGKEI